MWSRWLMVTVLGAGLANVAAAHGPGSRHIYARVLAVTPIVHEVIVERPPQECRREDRVTLGYAPGAEARIAGATMIGGVIGGAVGHELGRDRDRGALTAVGTLVGSTLAHRAAVDRELSTSGGVVERTVRGERCRVVTERHAERRVEGYLVIYEYHGRRRTIRTHQDPGPRLRLDFAARHGRDVF